MIFKRLDTFLAALKNGLKIYCKILMPSIMCWEFVLTNEDLLKIENPSDFKVTREKNKQICL